MEKKVFYTYEGSHNYYDTMKLKQKKFERAKQECFMPLACIKEKIEVAPLTKLSYDLRRCI
jgi:hypothetical protein